MITGKIKNQVDAIWMSFWTGGITNSIDALEQMTYLFFMKMVDDAQLSQEAKAAMMGMGDVELMSDAVFLIQQPRTLVKVVEGINALDMNDRDTIQNEINEALLEFRAKYMK